MRSTIGIDEITMINVRCLLKSIGTLAKLFHIVIGGFHLSHVMQHHNLVVLAVIAYVLFISRHCSTLSIFEGAAVPTHFIHEILIKLTFKHASTL